jgi:GT2 family glycosyltransferase
MKNPFPKVSIILVQYNQQHLTKACLDSLSRITYPNYEIFVIDNGSTNSSIEQMTHTPQIRWINSAINLGFAGGNNLALQQITEGHVLLLNNDTVVPAGFLEPLVATLINHPEAGIVSPKIKYFNSNDIIQYAGTGEIHPFTCRGTTRGFQEKDRGQWDEEIPTGLAHGACMLISRNVLDRIGNLYEGYFLYYEEYDYCLRARQAGFQIYYNGLTHILHKASMTVGMESSLKCYQMARNRILFARRNFSAGQSLASVTYYYVLAMPKKILRELLALRFDNLLAVIKGSIAGLFA